MISARTATENRELFSGWLIREREGNKAKERGRRRERGWLRGNKSNELPRQIFSASHVTENVDAAISLASVTQRRRRSIVPRAPLFETAPYQSDSSLTRVVNFIPSP